MKKIFFILFGILAMGAVQTALAQEIIIRDGRNRRIKAESEQQTRSYDVAEFTGINASAGIRVEVSRGDKNVEITSNTRVFEYLRVEVSGGVLRLGYRNNVSTKGIRTTVYVSVPEVSRIDASSGSTVVFLDPFTGDKLSLDASSAGSISGEAGYSDLRVTVSSGGSVKLRGKASSVNVSASSGASANLLATEAFKARVSASSGGSIKVNVAESITGSVSSGGSVRFAGDAKNIDVHKSTGGSVTMLR